MIANNFKEMKFRARAGTVYYRMRVIVLAERSPGKFSIALLFIRTGVGVGGFYGVYFREYFISSK